MDKMIAYCGIICNECPAFLATQKDDDEERKKVVEMWSTDEHNIKLEDINCDGCLQESGRHFSWCMECPTRKCAQERGLENCAYCDDYVCENLKNIFDMASEAKLTLEEIRKSL
jgi:hypothetical protein